MCKVNKFFCYELDKGGRIIGWIGKICCIIPIVLSIVLFLIGLFMSCDHVNKLLEKIPADGTLDCFTGKIAFGIFLIVLIGVFVIFHYIYSILIKGIKSRNHCQVLPALVCEVIVFVLCILGLATTKTFGGYIFYEVVGCLSFYCAIVLYSIYANIKSEKSKPEVV